MNWLRKRDFKLGFYNLNQKPAENEQQSNEGDNSARLERHDPPMAKRKGRRFRKIECLNLIGQIKMFILL
jgi:hypothetical protein